SEDLQEPRESLALSLHTAREAEPSFVARHAARAVFGCTSVAPERFSWLAPHEAPAVERLWDIVRAHGGALLADAVGLGKSYVALGLALSLGEPFLLVVPAVLVPQWSGLLEEMHVESVGIITHESFSVRGDAACPNVHFGFCIVDE